MKNGWPPNDSVSTAPSAAPPTDHRVLRRVAPNHHVSGSRVEKVGRVERDVIRNDGTGQCHVDVALEEHRVRIDVRLDRERFRSRTKIGVVNEAHVVGRNHGHDAAA